MSNAETVDAFVQVLLRAPGHTMQAVSARLAHTDYELKLLKADPLRDCGHGPVPAHLYQFPMETAERSLMEEIMVRR